MCLDHEASIAIDCDKKDQRSLFEPSVYLLDLAL